MRKAKSSEFNVTVVEPDPLGTMIEPDASDCSTCYEDIHAHNAFITWSAQTGHDIEIAIRSLGTSVWAWSETQDGIYFVKMQNEDAYPIIPLDLVYDDNVPVGANLDRSRVSSYKKEGYSVFTKNVTEHNNEYFLGSKTTEGTININVPFHNPDLKEWMNISNASIDRSDDSSPVLNIGDINVNSDKVPTTTIEGNTIVFIVYKDSYTGSLFDMYKNFTGQESHYWSFVYNVESAISSTTYSLQELMLNYHINESSGFSKQLGSSVNNDFSSWLGSDTPKLGVLAVTSSGAPGPSDLFAGEASFDLSIEAIPTPTPTPVSGPIVFDSTYNGEELELVMDSGSNALLVGSETYYSSNTFWSGSSYSYNVALNSSGNVIFSSIAPYVVYEALIYRDSSHGGSGAFSLQHTVDNTAIFDGYNPTIYMTTSDEFYFHTQSLGGQYPLYIKTALSYGDADLATDTSNNGSYGGQNSSVSFWPSTPGTYYYTDGNSTTPGQGYCGTIIVSDSTTTNNIGSWSSAGFQLNPNWHMENWTRTGTGVSGPFTHENQMKIRHGN